MDKVIDILQKQLHEITVSLDRVALLQCNENWRGHEGRPPYSSIGLIRRGTGTIIVNGEELHPVKDQLYLLPARSVQTFFNDGTQPYLKYFCHFNMKIHNVELFDMIHAPLCVEAKEPDVVIALFENMIKAHQEKSIVGMIRARQCMMELACYYFHCCEESDIIFAESAADLAVNKAIAYAEAHLDKNVSAAEMAQIAGYHPNHFAALFRKRFGVSPAKYIVRKKVDFAMEQLTVTSRSIADISDSLGFSSQFYFCNFFKKQTGMTPSEYRQLYPCLRNQCVYGNMIDE